MKNNFPDQREATPTRGYYLLRALIVLVAFMVGVIIGFIGWPCPINDKG